MACYETKAHAGDKNATTAERCAMKEPPASTYVLEK